MTYDEEVDAVPFAVREVYGEPPGEVRAGDPIEWRVWQKRSSLDWARCNDPRRAITICAALNDRASLVNAARFDSPTPAFSSAALRDLVSVMVCEEARTILGPSPMNHYLGISSASFIKNRAIGLVSAVANSTIRVSRLVLPGACRHFRIINLLLVPGRVIRVRPGPVPDGGAARVFLLEERSASAEEDESESGEGGGEGSEGGGEKEIEIAVGREVRIVIENEGPDRPFYAALWGGEEKAP